MRKIIFIFLISALLSGFALYFFNPPRVRSSAVDSRVIIKFDKPLKRQEISHIIVPEVYGEWSFEEPLFKNHLFRTLIFTPAVGFKPDTLYSVYLENITGHFNAAGNGNFSFSFKTQPAPLKENIAEKTPEPKITLIDIPLDWQDYPLSCETASLKMALHAKGVYVSEDEILQKIGYDMTPHMGNFWGDPDKAFVGNIYGDICKTGYGVYWQPVARAANYWRDAEVFSGWTLEQLIKEIELGNPVVFWGALSNGRLTDCSWWYGAEGKRVKAFYQTHVRVVAGFIGDPENPSKIIINDPLSGRLYWDTQDFLANWQVFGNSGVVVR